MLREGTIVDATLIAAPPSTKNSEGKRDEEMHQTKKGNQWNFGMKAHIGVDAQSGLVQPWWYCRSSQLLHRASRDPRRMKQGLNRGAASGTEVGLFLVR